MERKVKMVKSRIFIALILGAVLLSACASTKAETAIIGKWDRGGAVTEFKNDGTVIVTTTDGSVINGTYTFTDSKTLQLSMPAENGGTAAFTVSITGDTLTLSNDNGSADYTKVK
jgi:hypothetical protein